MKIPVADPHPAAKVALTTAAGESEPKASRPRRRRNTRVIAVSLSREELTIMRARERELNLGHSAIVSYLLEKEGEEGTLARWMRRRLRVELKKTKQV